MALTPVDGVRAMRVSAELPRPNRLTTELPAVRRPAVADFAQRHHRVIAESFAHASRLMPFGGLSCGLNSPIPKT